MVKSSASVTLPSAPLLPPAAVATRAPLALPHAVACRLDVPAAAASDAMLGARLGEAGWRPSAPSLPLSLPLPLLPPPMPLPPSLPLLPLPALPPLLM